MWQQWGILRRNASLGPRALLARAWCRPQSTSRPQWIVEAISSEGIARPLFLGDASYTFATNTWSFGGSASVVGYVKGYAEATAWPLKGEVYLQGNIGASAAINPASGIATANLSVVGSVGADAQIQSLFGGWTTIASTSRNLGSWQSSATVNVGTWLESAVGGAVATEQAAAVAASSAATVGAALPTASAVNVAAATPAAPVSSTPATSVVPTASSAVNLGTSVSSGAGATVTANARAGSDASVQAAALAQFLSTSPLTAAYLAA